MNKRIAVFASGAGSNFINIKQHIDKGEINAKIVLLISNNLQCGAANYAIKNNIEYKIINSFRYPDEKNKNKEYELVLKYYKTDLILLAGFMKKIPQNIIKKYNNKIMNIHPSLLPKYGGYGYYGMKVHDAVVKSKDKVSGATIHFVNEEYDNGPIIIQKKIHLKNNDDSNSLSKKVLKIEHKIYPEAVKAFCLNKIRINNNKVLIDE